MTEQGVASEAVEEVERRVVLSVLATHHPVRQGECGCGAETEDWPAHAAGVLERAEFIMWREAGLARGWLNSATGLFRVVRP